MRANKNYEIERSPLYQLSSKQKLSQLLNIDRNLLSDSGVASLTSQYNIFRDSHSRRFITEPRDDLLKIHKRLLALFRRIAPPDYVHSATKKRSYKSNAEHHVGSEKFLKIDIKKFFPSVKFHYIHSFFRTKLHCSPDVAVILAKLCTVTTRLHGIHLPTGSCISPILSFLVNRDLFDDIVTMCANYGCIATVYVDDITVSGNGASKELLTMIANEIHRHGYGYHKFKCYFDVPATVTGLIVKKDGLRLPHVRAKRIREVSKALKCASNETLRQKLISSLVGRLSEAEQIQPIYRQRRERVIQTYASDWKSIVETRAKKALRFKRK